MIEREWIFQKYGVSLTPILEADIEMVRRWRNDPTIAQLMINKQVISKEAQLAWFKKMQTDDKQLYCLAYFKNEPIAVVSLTEIDQNHGTAEPGMYVYPEQYRNNLVPFCVAFALNDMAFNNLNLSKLFGKIYPDNQASIRFHLASGYVEEGLDKSTGLIKYHLEPIKYEQEKQKIARFIRY